MDWEHLNPILTDIQALPECVGMLPMMDHMKNGFFFMRTYKKADQSEARIFYTEGSPSYFKFLNIPMQGKEVDEDAEGCIYVSESFKQQLDKDSVQGMVELNGQSYRIIGTFKALYKESQKEGVIGSVFFPGNSFGNFYFKLAPGTSSDKGVRRITDICRKYVPDTLQIGRASCRERV